MLSIHFDRSEFACKCGCGFDTVDAELLQILECVRSHFKLPVIINSACRCTHHNYVVGGKTHSYHLIGRAADIKINFTEPRLIYEFINEMAPNKLGLLCYDNFVHIDTRTGSKFRMDNGGSNGP